jgi:hypothetical protein
MTPRSKLRIASISKSFTAAALAVLLEQNQQQQQQQQQQSVIKEGNQSKKALYADILDKPLQHFLPGFPLFSVKKQKNAHGKLHQPFFSIPKSCLLIILIIFKMPRVIVLRSSTPSLPECLRGIWLVLDITSRIKRYPFSLYMFYMY